MLYRLRMLLTYSTSAIIYQTSCFFPRSSLHHLLQHGHDCCCFPRVSILGQPYKTFLLLFSRQFTLLLFSSVLIYLCFFIPFFSFSFSFFHAGFHLSSVSSPSIRMLPSSNSISTSASSIVIIASSTIKFSSMVFYLLHAALIHLFCIQVM